MKCSKCEREMPFNAPNWVKLKEDNFLTYKIENAVTRSYGEPYWTLCPECYEELFTGLQKYITKTTISIEEIDNHFTKSTADYYEQPTITVKSNHDFSGYDVFVGEDKVDIDKCIDATIAMPKIQ